MKKIVRYSLAIVLGCAVFLIFIHTIPFAMRVNGFISEVLIYQERSAVIGEKSVFLDVADTEKKLTKGLSGRKGLDENKGMIFMFDDDGRHGIWMKDMNFSIDIIWVNKHFEVVHIEKNISPETYPEVFSAPVPSRFVIEVEAGFTEAHNIKKGDLFTIL